VSRVVDGKYRLDRLLGKGGMGAVYEARDLRLGRAVAVKCLLGRQFGQQGALRRFRREARAAARLNHRNVVAVYDYGVLEGEGAYLVMELVRGVTLRAELQRSGSLTAARTADWFEPLLDGVAAAHAEGMVHRDLKPENVIGTDGDALEVRILDLGLVKLDPGESLSTDPLTAEGAVMGTLAYMAPEQLLGGDVDHRADVFAVGLMLVEALTGGYPFRDLDGRRSRGLRSGSCRVSGVGSEASALAALLNRCLEVEPQVRPGSAAALKRELAPLLRAGVPLELAVEAS
jgi:serine/threonine protein kinase